MGALGFTAFAGLSAALAGGVLAAVLLMGAVNMSGAIGKLGFDSIVQRNAPDANQGRAFAQFETKFQLAWVMAGIVPVLVPIPGSMGFAIVGFLALFAAVMYMVSMRRLQLGRPVPATLSSRAKRELRKRGGAPTGGNADGRHPPTGAGPDLPAATPSRPDARSARPSRPASGAHIPPTRELTPMGVPSQCPARAVVTARSPVVSPGRAAAGSSPRRWRGLRRADRPEDGSATRRSRVRRT